MESVALGLRTVVYPVLDLTAAKAWYSRAFGVAPYFDEGFYVGFNIGGYELGLDPNGVRSQQQGGAVSYWGVKDCAHAYAHFCEVGATTVEAPNAVGSGIIVATVQDPFGNAIGLIENPHFQLGH